MTEYRVHRSTTSGFTPSAANRVATVTSGTSYTDTGLATGTYHYRVVAADAAGNAARRRARPALVVTTDTTAPTVSVTAPAAGAAAGRDGLAHRHRLRQRRRGERAVPRGRRPTWARRTPRARTRCRSNTTTLSNGTHTLSAVARDAAGNTRHLGERDGDRGQRRAHRPGDRSRPPAGSTWRS